MNGNEAWTKISSEKKRLEALEMYCCTIMKKTNWTEEITNEGVVRSVREKDNIKNTLRRRDKLIGHILRHNRLMKTVLNGRIDGKS
jgi:predicted nucleotide-binding protein (sugar kinase/HSP70/actin superfamily)